MMDDARLGKLLLQSGILTPDALQELKSEQGRSKPPTSLFALVVKKAIATEEKLGELARRADAYSGTQGVLQKLGKFEVRGELGRGGMGVVYKAWQPDLQSTVALKVLPSNADPALKERFLREARLASRLRHPHVVAVHEYGEESGSAFFGETVGL